MKYINKLDFTNEKFIVLNQNENQVMEASTGKIYYAVPLSEPETEVALYEPEEYFDFEEKLLSQTDKFVEKLKNLGIAGA